jgi:probable HAF family extracellular repeat protein
MKLRQSFACACLVVLATSLPGWAAEYTITNLGTIAGFATQTIPAAINNSGQITGTAYSGADPSLPYHAFLYTAGTMQDLQTLGGANSGALGINDNGQVAGYSDLAASVGQPVVTQAFLYSGGVMKSLGSLIDGGSSDGTGINDLGAVVGDSAAPITNPPAKHVVVFSGGNITDLGNNDSGQITGSYYLANNSNHAYIYTAGTLNDLGTLGGANSAAVAINSAGEAVGVADLGGGVSHAFIFDGTMHDLGSVGGGNSSAAGLNDLGQVVGSSTVSGASHAFLYSAGSMLDLNSLIDPTSGWTLSTANAINDLGQITGTGIFDGQQRAYVLTHVPEPAGLALAAPIIVGALAWLSAQANRRRC